MSNEFFSIIFTCLGILGSWTVFVEWRIRTMQANVRDKIEDRDEINKVVQAALRVDIARLEAKIDQLINLQLKNIHNDKS